MLNIRLLGAFELSYEGGDVCIHGRHEQSLFAYLLLNSGVHHRREKLAAMFWPDLPEDAARDNLRHILWKIRKALPTGPVGGYLFSDELVVAFNWSAEYHLDVDLLKSAGRAQTADDLLAALGSYRGELLPGFTDEWVTLEREYLNHVFEHNMARLMSMLEGEKRWLDILEWGERWLTFGQRPEPAFRALMTAHMEMGEMPRVADVYTRCVRSLAELGLEPSFETRSLYERLRAGKAGVRSK